MYSFNKHGGLADVLCTSPPPHSHSFQCVHQFRDDVYGELSNSNQMSGVKVRMLV